MREVSLRGPDRGRQSWETLTKSCLALAVTLGCANPLGAVLHLEKGMLDEGLRRGRSYPVPVPNFPERGSQPL